MQIEPLVQEITALARSRIAGREDLYDPAQPFPFDIWAEMGRAGMLGLGMPREYGGGGCSYAQLMAAGEAFVNAGRNVGLASAWLGNTLTGRLILGRSGTEAQKREYIPRLATGDLVAAIAISEPNAGAHPKRLSTRAVREGNQWMLNGEKAWLTNGPIAGLYIILAISSETDGRKEFSAFLVPRETPGLTQTTEGSVDFLRPTQHGGLMIKDCHVPAENQLGRLGEAFETISLPIREIEDTLGLGTGLGGRAAQLELLAEAIRAASIDPGEAQFEKLGALQVTQAASRALATSLAGGLDSGTKSGPEAYLLAAKRLSRQFQADFSECVKSLQLPENIEISRLSRDLTKLADLAVNVDRAKQGKLGKSLIMKAG